MPARLSLAAAAWRRPLLSPGNPGRAVGAILAAVPTDRHRRVHPTAPRRRWYTTRDEPAEPFRILFCGSDEFSTAALRALLAAEDVWESVTVMTPRERAVDRGKKNTYTPPLKLFALERDLEHHDVPLGGLDFPAPFRQHHPAHLLLTASFGHIVPTPLLGRFGYALNVHPSALPRYRGAAPVQWAIANRDESTGVSVQSMAPREVGVDAGAILGSIDTIVSVDAELARLGGTPIRPDATYGTLMPELAHVAGRMLVQVLRQLQTGRATPRPQDVKAVTRAPKITTARAQVRWAEQGAADIEARHRAWGHHHPVWATLPTTATSSSGSPSPAGAGRDAGVQFTAVSLPDGDIPNDVSAKADEAGSRPGTVVLDKPRSRVLVLTRDGWLDLQRVKAAGKRELPAREWWNGLPKTVRERGWGVFE